MGAGDSLAAAYWNERHRDPDGAARDDPMSHPLVRAYLTLRAVAAVVDPLDVVARELERRTPAGGRVLSLASGRGNHERLLAAALPDRAFVGVDIAAGAVARANDDAARAGLRNVRFEVGDLDALALAPASFDAIVGIAAIHHVAELEAFWCGCRRGLRRGGAVLAQEYVGPSRLQWTDAQLEHGTRALRDLVPADHAAHAGRVERTPLDVMLREDPSEAVRSAEILPTCRAAGFAVGPYAGAGGGLLQPVLTGRIAAFDPRDWRHNRVLAELFAEEDRLMAAGVLDDSFAMFVATPRA